MWKTTLFLKSKFACVLSISILSFLYSCKEYKSTDERKVARVGTAILHEGDILEYEDAETKEDSLILRERFVNNWIHKQLLLQTAKLNLTQEEQEIENLVNEYRTSLLINQYKQKYLREHLDTLVKQEDIALYVEEHSEKFILKSPLYKYYLAKIASKNKRDIRFVYKLFSKKNFNLMQNFNLASSTVITNNDTGWYTVQELRKALEKAVSEKRLIRLIERKPLVLGSKDKKYVYVLLPLKIIRAGQMTPNEYLSDRVREIILHNRKLALVKQLEYEIYEDAKKKNEFEVY